MDLISREEAIKQIHETFDNQEWATVANVVEKILIGVPTIEKLVTVEYKQNEWLYLETDEDTLLETEYIVMSTDGMYKEYVHETE